MIHIDYNNNVTVEPTNQTLVISNIFFHNISFIKTLSSFFLLPHAVYCLCFWLAWHLGSTFVAVIGLTL